MSTEKMEPVAWMVMNGVVNYQLVRRKAVADALVADLQMRHDLSGSLAEFSAQPLYAAYQLQAAVAEKQAIIDRLMLEFCPDEMTPEQIEEWKRHQVPAAIRQLGDEQ